MSSGNLVTGIPEWKYMKLGDIFSSETTFVHCLHPGVPITIAVLMNGKEAAQRDSK